MLEEIEQLREELRQHHVGPQQRWTKQLRRNLTARAIAGSNTIEGYRRAVTYIQALSDAGDDFPFDTGLINGLHHMIQEHQPGKRPGRLRRGPVCISHPDDELVPVYTAPDKDAVPGLMAELIAWLNDGDLESPVHVRASMAHLNLVTCALLPAFLGQKVRRKLYQIDAELSEQQSIRDMRQMVTLGWLDSHGEARGRYYTAGPLMLRVTAEVGRETKPFINPYRRRDD